MKNRRFIISLLSLTIVSHAWSQSSDRNYIRHRVYTDESRNCCQTEVSYYDGLGKPIQNMSNANSSEGIYVVTNTKYDEMGRAKHEWLPTPMTSSCTYVSKTEFPSSATSYYKDTKPYAQTLYDALDRPLEKYLSGEDWYAKGKSVKYSYGSNTANQVRLFQAPLGSDRLEDSGFYAANTLTVETETDEDNRTVETFKDVLGNKVLERRNGDNDTYDIFNDKGNVIQTLSTNHLGGTETFSHNYSFTDKVIATYHKHTEEGRNPIEEETIFTYDKHTDKLQAIDHRIGEYDLKRLVDFTYDDNGLLVSKNIAGIERLNYSYNLRQWLLGISGEYFNETLCYNTDVDGTTPKHPLYSGNISAQSWHMIYDSKYRTYDYNYDNLWQLTSASYTVWEDSQQYEGGYDTSYSYDSMGNILHLTRNSAYDYDGGYEINDDIYLRYHGNQLIRADNTAYDHWNLGMFHSVDKVQTDIEYTYDANGNMTSDKNKGIESITYNVLNLPSRIFFTNGEGIGYLYNSAGTLLQKKYYTSLSNIANPENLATPLVAERSLKEQKDYCGNITYDGNWYNVLFDGGMAYFYPDSIPYYQFQVHDHQGNVRASLYWNGGIAQVNHYYPFGGLMRESYYDGQPYRYNGKELDRMYGLDWYDYGARMYDGTSSRWHSMDNQAEKNCNVSPYAYCHNNPVNKYDLDGNDDFFSNQGVFLYSTKTGADIYVRNGRSSVPFRSLNLRSPHNMQVAANIVGHYARAVGISYNMNGGIGKVGVSTLHGTKANTVALTDKGNIYMKMTNGRLDEDMYNVYNLRNTLKHENGHKLLRQERKKQDDFTHMNIICNQMADEDFKKGSTSFIKGTIGYLISFMNKHSDSKDTETFKILGMANHILRSLGYQIRKRGNSFYYAEINN